MADYSELDEIKQVELQLFRDFLACCEELHLRHYLIGGTLLGAVRHGGFIPWDDDIDLCMPRGDYERFLAEGQRFLPEYCFLQCRRTDPELLCNYAKLRDSRTTFIEASVKKQHINHGVFIDVFPLDYAPEARWKRRVLEARKKLLTLRVRAAFTYLPENQRSPAAERMGKLASRLLTLKYPRPEDALDAREALYRSVPPSALLANYCGAWGSREIVPAAWFGEGKELLFEGIPARVPTEYEKWLTQVYGDYMTPPPEDKRIQHHYTTVIDLKRPYTDYCKAE